MYSRGDGVLKEEKSLEEIHKIREELYKMDNKEKRELLKKIKEKYNDLFLILKKKNLYKGKFSV